MSLVISTVDYQNIKQHNSTSSDHDRLGGELMLSKIDWQMIRAMKEHRREYLLAGYMARMLRPGIRVTINGQSGNQMVDVLTSADLEIQEEVLRALVQSETLLSCQMRAEENTPSVARFYGKSLYTIVLDPIDGTFLYINDHELYSLLIGMHNEQQMIYSFNFYPEIRWGLEIVGDKTKFFGSTPKLPEEVLSQIASKTIGYVDYSHDPRDILPSYLYQSYLDNGYNFVRMTETEGYGPNLLFLLGTIDGLFTFNGNAVDAFMPLHFAQAQGYSVVTTVDFSSLRSGPAGYGDIYPGYFITTR